MQTEINDRIQDFSKAVERETRQMSKPLNRIMIAERVAKQVAEDTFMSMSKELPTPLYLRILQAIRLLSLQRYYP